MQESIQRTIKQYIEYCNQSKPNLRALLGDVLYVKTNDGKIIANLFGQYNTGINKRQTDYNALNETFNKLRGYMLENEIESVAFPYMLGCGLGGGS